MVLQLTKATHEQSWAMTLLVFRSSYSYHHLQLFKM